MTGTSDVSSRVWDAAARAAGASLGLAEKAAGRSVGVSDTEEEREAALEKVQEARESVSKTTFRMWDRHAEMVKKSQALHKAKIRKDAIARRNRQNRERQTELLAEMALENARRSKWLNAASLQQRKAASPL